jgi:hypothetical protein
MIRRVSPSGHQPSANRLDVRRAEPPDLWTVFEAWQPSFLGPESYRPIGDAKSDCDGVHRQDTFAVRCKRVHVTFLEAGRQAWHRAIAGRASRKSPEEGVKARGILYEEILKRRFRPFVEQLRRARHKRAESQKTAGAFAATGNW